MGPTFNPNGFMAVFTGMGLTSRKRSFISCRYFRWLATALGLPAVEIIVHDLVAHGGITLAYTEMTPLPPMLMRGTVISSLPE